MDEIINELQSSKKYKNIYLPTLRAVAEDCASRYGEKEALDKAKNLLHQTWGAFWETRPDFGKLVEKVKKQLEEGEEVKKIVSPLLMLQSSTKERLSILEEFYTSIFNITGTPQTITEHACGLNPLAYFWMNLPKETLYKAYDIDIPQAEFLNQVFKIFRVENSIKADLGDVLIEDFAYSDVVFLLKAIPCLERQGKDEVLNVIRKQNCKYLVVSYPTKSIGGSEKGMTDFYNRQFTSWAEKEHWTYETLIFRNELVFIIKK